MSPNEIELKKSHWTAPLLWPLVRLLPEPVLGVYFYEDCMTPLLLLSKSQTIEKIN
jgi:hypothetical protein